jgi:hypothetical protein
MLRAPSMAHPGLNPPNTTYVVWHPRQTHFKVSHQSIIVEVKQIEVLTALPNAAQQGMWLGTAQYQESELWQMLLLRRRSGQSA